MVGVRPGLVKAVHQRLVECDGYQRPGARPQRCGHAPRISAPAYRPAREQQQREQHDAVRRVVEKRGVQPPGVPGEFVDAGEHDGPFVSLRVPCVRRGSCDAEPDGARVTTVTVVNRDVDRHAARAVAACLRHEHRLTPAPSRSANGAAISALTRWRRRRWGIALHGVFGAEGECDGTTASSGTPSSSSLTSTHPSDCPEPRSCADPTTACENGCHRESGVQRRWSASSPG